MFNTAEQYTLIALIVVLQSVGDLIGAVTIVLYFRDRFNRQYAALKLQYGKRLRTQQYQIEVLMDALSSQHGGTEKAAEHLSVWRALKASYSADELATVGFQIDVELAEAKTRDARAMELVKAARERDKLDDLKRIVIEERPAAASRYGLI